MTAALKLPDWLSLERIPIQLGSLSGSSFRSDSRPTAFVGWDRRTITYIVVEKRKDSLSRLEAGKLERGADSEPLLQLRDHLADRIKVGSVVVVLSRAELEATELSLPPAEESEYTSLVHAQIEEGLSDGEEFPAVDYFELFRMPEGGLQVTAYIASAELMKRLKATCDQARWRLAAVVPRGLMPLGLLSDSLKLRWNSSVALTLLDGEAEWIVLREGKTRRQRTIRSGSDESDLLGDQIWSEIHRSIAIEGTHEEEPHLIAFGEPTRLAELTGPLLSRFRDDVTTVQPFQTIPGTASDELHREQHAFGPLVGAAKLFFDKKLPVDLVHPKAPPKQVHPVRRWAPVGALAVFALLVLGYVLRSDIVALQTEYDEKKTKLDRDEKLANKQAEKADIARVVDAWRADEFNWLEPLEQLSEKLPAGPATTVRRLTGTATGNGVVIDLSVQVDDESTVALLENSLRSPEVAVTSRRVAERGSGTDYPWQFETQINFSRDAIPIAEPPEYDDLVIDDASEEDTSSDDAPSEDRPSEAADRDATTRSASDEPLARSNREEQTP